MLESGLDRFGGRRAACRRKDFDVVKVTVDRQTYVCLKLLREIFHLLRYIECSDFRLCNWLFGVVVRSPHCYTGGCEFDYYPGQMLIFSHLLNYVFLLWLCERMNVLSCLEWLWNCLRHFDVISYYGSNLFLNKNIFMF